MWVAKVESTGSKKPLYSSPTPQNTLSHQKGSLEGSRKGSDPCGDLPNTLRTFVGEAHGSVAIPVPSSSFFRDEIPPPPPRSFPRDPTRRRYIFGGTAAHNIYRLAGRGKGRGRVFSVPFGSDVREGRKYSLSNSSVARMARKSTEAVGALKNCQALSAKRWIFWRFW